MTVTTANQKRHSTGPSKRPNRQLLARFAVATAAIAALIAPNLQAQTPALAEDAPVQEYTSPSDPTVKYTAPTVLKPGQDIVISGTGWTNTAGSEGSLITVLIDAARSGDPNTVYTKRNVVDPTTGSVETDKRLQAIIKADASGKWQATIPYPTAENAQLANGTWNEWQPDSEHTLRFLTGTRLEGDKGRSLSAKFKVAPAPTTPGTPSDPGTPTSCSPSVPQATVSIDQGTAKLGETLKISGKGWCHKDPTQGGSVIGIKLDGGAYSRIDDSVHRNKTIWALVTADAATGDWTHELQLPDGTAATSTPAFPEGEHTLQLLTGSLKPGDTQRSIVTGKFIVGDVQAGPADPPTWEHVTVTGEGATAWVQKDVAAGDNGKLKIKGTGWQNQAKTGGSTVAIKINASDTKQYEHSGSDIVSHPSAPGDATIWALLAPQNPSNHKHVFKVEPDGNFEIEIDAPKGLTKGQYLTVRFQSGLFAASDVARTLTTEHLSVDGETFKPADSDSKVTCVPSVPEATISIDQKSAKMGGLLRVSGKGWCHPGEKMGGSRIAFKIDEGKYSHLTSDLHSNRTIWALVDANPANGDFVTDIRLPDGTAATSAPAFENGVHTLRLLTGSLIEGDKTRSMKSAEFVVGEYAPGALPDPLDIAGGALTEANRGSITVERIATPAPGSWKVRVPGAQEGDWLFINTYAGNSARTSFPEWYRADKDGSVTLSLAGVTLQAGRLAVTVQSGNEGKIGDLLGWTEIVIAADPAPQQSTLLQPQPAAAPAAAVTRPAATTQQTRRTVRTLVASPANTAPTVVPELAIKRASQLKGTNKGKVTGVIDGTVLTITAADKKAREWVYAQIFTGADVRAVGWVQLDNALSAKIDIADLPDGNHKVALFNETGELIGWVSAPKGEIKAATLTEKQETKKTSDGGEDTATPVEAGDESGAGIDPLTLNLLLAGAGLLVLAGGITGALVIVKRKRG
ncbi:hypothetical protein [Leucobacter sp. OH1287]|uniref:hypothetical protein n=1 Tax=Leucobacter sp. OH1287 TaxID=2491049 RepID=UPI000F5D7A6E|nr:hypothetical protein [Leucobacter sp. OH1287]RRD61179.1 hypothetical protein EII30_03510 [Leucobacter sp. OH1287]